MGNVKSGTLSNVEARTWYLEQEAKIPSLLNKNASLEQQARQAFIFPQPSLTTNTSSQREEQETRLANIIYSMMRNKTEYRALSLIRNLKKDDIIVVIGNAVIAFPLVEFKITT